MTNIIPFAKKSTVSFDEKRASIMNALIRFIVSVDSSNGTLSTLDEIKNKALYLYETRIKSTRDLNRFYNNLKKVGV